MDSLVPALSPVYLPAAPEVLPPEIYPVQEFHEALKEAAKSLRITTMRVAFFSHRMRMAQGWVMLGFEDGPRGEEQYRESLGIPRSTYYRAARIGQVLHQLTLPELERIPLTNAEILLSVDPTLWHDHPWVFEAKNLQPEKLAELVTIRNKAIGSEREPLVTMSFRVPLLAQKSVIRMLEDFMRKHELSSKSQALEMLIADRYDQRNTVGLIEKARRLIEGAYLKMSRSQAKRINMADEMTWTKMAMEVLDEAGAQALQASRQAGEGGQEDGGRP